MENIEENKLRKYTVVLKDVDKNGENVRIECNSYSPYWIFHAYSGYVVGTIRTFDLVNDIVKIVPIDSVKMIIEHQGAREALRSLNVIIKKETDKIKEIMNKEMGESDRMRLSELEKIKNDVSFV